jgi:hypothetical protein
MAEHKYISIALDATIDAHMRTVYAATSDTAWRAREDGVFERTYISGPHTWYVIWDNPDVRIVQAVESFQIT